MQCLLLYLTHFFQLSRTPHCIINKVQYANFVTIIFIYISIANIVVHHRPTANVVGVVKFISRFLLLHYSGRNFRIHISRVHIGKSPIKIRYRYRKVFLISATNDICSNYRNGRPSNIYRISFLIGKKDPCRIATTRSESLRAKVEGKGRI